MTPRTTDAVELKDQKEEDEDKEEAAALEESSTSSASSSTPSSSSLTLSATTNLVFDDGNYSNATNNNNDKNKRNGNTYSIIQQFRNWATEVLYDIKNNKKIYRIIAGFMLSIGSIAIYKIIHRNPKFLQLFQTLWSFLQSKLQSQTNNSTIQARQRQNQQQQQQQQQQQHYPTKNLLIANLGQFHHDAKQGLIEQALIGSDKIIYRHSSHQTNDNNNNNNNSTGKSWKQMNLPQNIPSLHSDLIQALTNGGCLDISSLPPSLASQLATPLLAAVPFIYLALVYKFFLDYTSPKKFDSTLNSKSKNNINTPTTFQNIAGMDPSIMTQVQEIVTYLSCSSDNTMPCHLLPRGILLHGPPGTGKTLLARAIAGELQSKLSNTTTKPTSSSLNFIPCTGSDFVEIYVGQGAARIRSLFQQAKQSQNNNKNWFSTVCKFWNKKSSHHHATSIIFIDEFDALAKTRGGGGSNGSFHSNNEERDQTLNQLLTEMDGFYNNNNNNNNNNEQTQIIVIAATNRADVLDPAILRRFDCKIHVGFPTTIGRCEILQLCTQQIIIKTSTNNNNNNNTTTMSNKKIQLDNNNHNGIDWMALSQMTNGCSGAEIQSMVQSTIILALRNNKDNDNNKVIVKQEHFVQAITEYMNTKKQISGRNNNDNNNYNGSIMFPFVMPSA